MIDAICTAVRRFQQAWESRQNERRLDALTRKRHAENGTHLGAVWLFVVLSGCAHGPTTGTLTTAHHAALAACEAEYARIEAEAADDATGQAALDAALVRCMESLRAICEPRDTCGGVFR